MASHPAPRPTAMPPPASVEPAEPPGPAPSAAPVPARRGWLTRPRASALVLVAATAAALYLCWLMARPFVPSFAWALTLAIVGHRLHGWIMLHVRRPDLSAGFTTLALILFVAVPLAVVAPLLADKVGEGWSDLRSESVQSRVQDVVRANPALAPVVSTVLRSVPSDDELAKALAPHISGFLMGSMWAVMELLVTFFALFYLLRDRGLILDYVRDMLPLTPPETRHVFRRVAEVVRASVLGTLLVAAVQGLLGGLMFWWLDLPAPLLWGTVMFVLSILPILGAAIVWIPAALFLAFEGSWDKAIILTLWGSIVVALIDNLLYPIFVGDTLRLHTVPVFVALVGGLLVFGAAGLVIGPLVLAVSAALLEIWRQRTRGGRAADAPRAGA